MSSGLWVSKVQQAEDLTNEFCVLACPGSFLAPREVSGGDGGAGVLGVDLLARQLPERPLAEVRDSFQGTCRFDAVTAGDAR